LTAAAIYGQSAAALLAGAAVTFAPLPRRRLVGLLAALAALFSLAPILHGALGAPSFTLTQIAVLRLSGYDRLISSCRSQAAALVAVAVVFYPLSLGLGPFDPFDLGYRPLPFLLSIAALGLWLAWRRQEVALTLLGFDLLAYATGLFDNLWNACLDPLLVLLAIFALLRGPWSTAAAMTRRRMKPIASRGATAAERSTRNVFRPSFPERREGEGTSERGDPVFDGGQGAFRSHHADRRDRAN
jgi:hypothetical protein